MIRSSIESSCLSSVGYDKQLKLLEIEFRSGSVYQYFDVPTEIYSQLSHAPSAGRYFNKYIAYKFRYKLVENYSYQEASKQDRINNPPTADSIKHLYKKLAFRFHPDRAQGYEKLMKEINTLYEERNYYMLKEIAKQYNCKN